MLEPLLISTEEDVNKCNVGKFTVTSGVVMHSPDQFAEVLSMLEFVPLRVEHMVAHNNFEYEGLSPLFDEVKPVGSCYAVPHYNIDMETTNGKISGASVTKVVEPDEPPALTFMPTIAVR